MKNTVSILFVIASIVGMVIGGGIIWSVFYNLFHGFGMNWIVCIIGCIVFGVSSATYNKVMEG